MSSVTSQAPSVRVRALSLRVLVAYAVLAGALNAWRMAGDSGSVAFCLADLVLIAALLWSLPSRSRVGQLLGDWLPWVALPLFYWGLRWTAIGAEGRLFDTVVQGWDRAMFGTDPAHTLAGALPSRLLSELLHLAYLAYYAIIYLPPLLLYCTGERRGYFETTLAFTLTMVAAFIAFNMFPVEGPRFAWSAPPGVPAGPVRSVALFLLRGGSTRGTAFPSSHVAIALAQTLSVLYWRRGWGRWMALATVLLATGAVYGGFHYASDVFAGALLGMAAWGVAWGFVWRGSDLRILARREP